MVNIKNITIKEIASLAGVSRGTVDRVLHNRTGVSQENIDKVNKIVKEYNFKPNTMAKALANKQKSKKIGIILNCLGNNFFDDLLRGIYDGENEFSNYGSEYILIKLEGYNSEEQVAAINSLVNQGIDGLIITPLSDEVVINRLEELKIPIVACNMEADFKTRLVYVGCDYAVSGRIAAAAMAMHAFAGVINVGIVHGSIKIKSHRKRYEAFKSIAEKCKNINIIDYFYTEDNNKTAFEKTTEMINKYNLDFIYVVASGIEGVMEAIDKSGKKIYAITNDIIPVTREYFNKDIIKAVVYQDPYKQGYESISAIMDYIYTGSIGNTNFKINSELITKYNIPTIGGK